MKAGSKYHPLYQYLHDSSQAEITLTFAAIDALIGGLPGGARTSRTWWGNRRTGSAQADAWMQAGYHVVDIDLDGATVTWRKPTPTYQVRRVGNRVLWDGELVKALRHYMALSQAELAEELGVRQQTISEWETGMYQPKRAMSKLLTLVAEQAGFRYGEEEKTDPS